MANYIIVKSTNMNDVVRELLKLGGLGAEFKGESMAIKVGALYTAKVYIEDDSKVVYSAIVMKGKTVVPVKEEVVEPVKIVDVNDGDEPKKFTKAELDVMSIGDVRAATGIQGKSKKDTIAEYLNQ